MENKSIKLPSFVIELTNDKDTFNIIDIIMNDTKHKVSKKEVTSEETAIVITELVQSRIASEEIIAQLTTDKEKLEEEINYLLDKVNSHEKSLDELRGN
ncbi:MULTISPECIES: hypothetical protein [Staphylococcus]|uniref:Phage protein n=2 Tax=Staphylococcus TaxID=1279 RepID=A0ABX3Z0X3_9STAP|nr:MULTISPECIES: hypothetical protein [Staphylococcus]AJC95820.1 hypothetical protein SHYC_05320 [Staphylococcus hyicus]MCQ9299553.1 hypothetical protein [Staphylococcus hyicus]MDG4943901.1 hypothetical protein [Staphylococcus agnetis]MDP4448292.1 hypothetical protein [Staphylococcus hyicus]MDP4459792.1 hypothetical protein [Staphylococcus hyicus]